MIKIPIHQELNPEPRIRFHQNLVDARSENDFSILLLGKQMAIKRTIGSYKLLRTKETEKIVSYIY